MKLPLVRIPTLTPAERLIIERRRHRESQRDAAVRYGVTHYCFRQWEMGSGSPPKAPIGKLTPGEECFILRVRQGMQLQELAAAIGVTPNWVVRMEYGDAPPARLVDYWERCRRPFRPCAKAV